MHPRPRRRASLRGWRPAAASGGPISLTGFSQASLIALRACVHRWSPRKRSLRYRRYAWKALTTETRRAETGSEHLLLAGWLCDVPAAEFSPRLAGCRCCRRWGSKRQLRKGNVAVKTRRQSSCSPFGSACWPLLSLACGSWWWHGTQRLTNMRAVFKRRRQHGQQRMLLLKIRVLRLTAAMWMICGHVRLSRT